MRKKRQFAILEQSNFGATASTASASSSGLGGLMGAGSAAADRIVTRSQLGSLAGVAAEQAQAPQRARRGSAPAGALPKVPEVSNISAAATPRELQRETNFSARSALAAAMSRKMATDSAADSAADRSASGGELILFTVTLCANPAHNLTCPSFIYNLILNYKSCVRSGRSAKAEAEPDAEWPSTAEADASYAAGCRCTEAAECSSRWAACCGVRRERRGCEPFREHSQRAARGQDEGGEQHGGAQGAADTEAAESGAARICEGI